MTDARLALAAVTLVGSLSMAQAQRPAERGPLHAAPAVEQPGVRVADMMGGMGQQGGSAQPGAAPMSPGMQAQPGQMQPGMGMMDDKMGGMAAQGGNAAAGPQAAMPMMMSMAAGRGDMGLVAHVEGRIAFLQAELAITDGQMPQWHAFADAMRSAAKSMQAAVAAQPGTPATAPERGEREIKLLTARLDAMRAMHAAGTSLYAVLSDGQKKLADELMAGSMANM